MCKIMSTHKTMAQYFKINQSILFQFLLHTLGLARPTMLRLYISRMYEDPNPL